MKTLKLIYLDEYQGELDRPYINSSDGLDALLNSSEGVLECYTSNLALYYYFKLCIKSGILDHETSCVEHHGKAHYCHASGKAIDWPKFDSEHMRVVGKLMSQF